jgi:hypothetical protein
MRNTHPKGPAMDRYPDQLYIQYLTDELVEVRRSLKRLQDKLLSNYPVIPSFLFTEDEKDELDFDLEDTMRYIDYLNKEIGTPTGDNIPRKLFWRFYYRK